MNVESSENKNVSVMVMSGNKDAYQIIDRLAQLKKFNIIATNTTNYGAEIAKKSGADQVVKEALDQEAIEELVDKFNIKILIDATHPFAAKATMNSIHATAAKKIVYIRFERPKLEKFNKKNIYYAKSFQEAVDLVLNLLETNSSNGKIMHLAGVSTLNYVLKKIDKEKVYVRILPSINSIQKCLNLGLKPENIIAMQGTFSKEFNRALMKEYGVSIIITKESGLSGGTPSKISAAIELGLDVVIIERPEIVELTDKKVFTDINQLVNYLINEMGPSLF
ncbi:MAG: precorrin-6A reductase [Methanobacteriaceae archaeon]|nr:precorrin-6A reductase [Methanobacteriaceae archaeon]